ncbi:MAG: DUF3450 family protein [Lysobacterales bacterium]
MPCCLMLATGAYAQQSPDPLAERLVTLRGQVDTLQSELDIRREEHKNRMVYLTAQLTELEASRDREALRVTKLRDDLAEMREEIERGGLDSNALQPFVLDQVDVLRDQISRGLPFKTGDRLAELDELATQLQNGVITAQRGINRLWAFVEDEIRISKENAIYSQSITIDGRNMLVDVAKLGSVMMFFRTRDLDYGRAVYGPQGWRFEMLESNADKEKVAVLFDSLRKQIRQGYFELPAVLPARMEDAS